MGAGAMVMRMNRPVDLLRILLLTVLLVAAPLRAYAQSPAPEPASATVEAAGEMGRSHAHCHTHERATGACKQHQNHHGHAPHCSGCLHLTLSALPTTAVLPLLDVPEVLAMEPATHFSSPLLPVPSRPPQAI